jgi:hypothetical protein
MNPFLLHLTPILSLLLLRVLLFSIFLFLLLNFYLHILFYTFFPLFACSSSPSLLLSVLLYNGMADQQSMHIILPSVCRSHPGSPKRPIAGEKLIYKANVPLSEITLRNLIFLLHAWVQVQVNFFSSSFLNKKTTGSWRQGVRNLLIFYTNRGHAVCSEGCDEDACKLKPVQTWIVSNRHEQQKCSSNCNASASDWHATDKKNLAFWQKGKIQRRIIKEYWERERNESSFPECRATL